ncbi:DUF3052 domain-containing protein [Isoptericola sp. b441]|uniref:DUF3052 domain-containing protein n=1 Tax=Actinotalea lenta TaxID=3064654 RepID=A0ABT9DEM7_9CELL|nr:MULTISPECIES: DUF3052 domain-containing protein [unclassified Isoptericola]MDO8108056.1 DUF3052 domain-containing protein [Isoptericola sp. b441]MDO8120275.1 DUF3052 domain-containing protein [Isoptericola sp. b490]
MGSTATNGGLRLGFEHGQVVQEFGYGDDVDEQIRADIAAATGQDMADEDFDDVIDAVVLWWRDGDGDLTDALLDVCTTLDDGGFVWLFTPKTGRPGTVVHTEIEEAATTAGLHATSTVAIGPAWSGTRLGTRKGR